MDPKENNPKPAVSEPVKTLPLEKKGLGELQKKFLEENTEKIKKEEGSKK